MSNVHIIVGSVMGNAARVAQHIAEQLSEYGHEVKVNTQVTPDALNNGNEFLLICTSNTGMGDPPANIAPLLVHLQNDCPNIAGRRYAIVNLGDSSYPNFAQAGKTFDEAFTDLGAVRALEPLIIDAIYDDDPLEPTADWLPKLQECL